MTTAAPDPGTPLDAAIAAMEAGGPGADLRFWDTLAGTELFVLLAGDADPARPRVFALEDGPTILAFDREARLADVAGAADYAAMTGRTLAAAVAGQGASLGLNLGTTGAATLLPDAALLWFAEALRGRAAIRDGRPTGIAPPDVPDTLLHALDAKLPTMAGLADAALLVSAEWGDGQRAPLLAVLDARPGAEEAIAAAVAEAVTFSGYADDPHRTRAGVDVTFLPSGSDAARRLEAVALRFDLPSPAPGLPARPEGPGMDPDRPPRLR